MATSEVFYLDQLSFAVDASSAILEGEVTTVLDASANANVTIPVSVAQELFQFSTDASDVDNIVADDILYRVVYDTATNYALSLDIDASASVTAITAIHEGAVNNNVTYDFVRYLAKCLFNTHLGVDLFANEEELRTELNISFKSGFDVVLTDLTAAGVTDATGTSPSKSLLLQLLASKPNRFQDIETDLFMEQDINGHPWYKMPLDVGDVINFVLTVNPAVGQEDLTGVVQLSARTYLIQMNIE